MIDMNKKLAAGIVQLGLDIPELSQEKMVAFLQFLKKWNKAYNLTAIIDDYRMITHHLLDSLAIAPYIKGDHIVDVGSGAGLPGIPLAIYYPSKQFVLIDSVGKKTRFINQAARHLGLSNVKAVHTRAEQYPTSLAFDTMTCRAVGSMEYMQPIAAHLLKPAGQLLVMKTDVSEEERANLSENADVIALSVPGISSTRSLIIV